MRRDIISSALEDGDNDTKDFDTDTTQTTLASTKYIKTGCKTELCNTCHFPLAEQRNVGCGVRCIYEQKANYYGVTSCFRVFYGEYVENS